MQPKISADLRRPFRATGPVGFRRSRLKPLNIGRNIGGERLVGGHLTEKPGKRKASGNMGIFHSAEVSSISDATIDSGEGGGSIEIYSLGPPNIFGGLFCRIDGIDAISREPIICKCAAESSTSLITRSPIQSVNR